MCIALIGWGSLIWCPGGLPLNSAWRLDGPPVPLEYARISRDGRLTLVIQPGAEIQSTYWAEFKTTVAADARRQLQAREGCDLAAIHGVAADGLVYGSPSEPVKQLMLGWLRQKDRAAAFWTALKSNWVQKRAREFTVDDALAYLRALHNSTAPDGDLMRDRARDYIQNTPPQIQTEVRRRAREECDWRDADLPPFLFDTQP